MNPVRAMSAIRPSMMALVSTSISAAGIPASASPTVCTPTRRRMPRCFFAAVNANRYPSNRNIGSITQTPM